MIKNGSQSEVSKSIISLMSNWSISENELCNKDFIYDKITNLPELYDNDIINMENIKLLLAVRDDIENLEKNYHVTNNILMQC